MNPLKTSWAPEIIENTPFSHVMTPPLGKPDPYSFRIEKALRPRVFQKAQVGPTCLFYAAKKISPRMGKFASGHPLRDNEKAISCFRRAISSTHGVHTIPVDDEFKNYLITRFLSLAGFKTHFPWHARCMELVCQSQATPMVIETQHLPKPLFNMVCGMQRIYTGLSLRLMLQRMFITPLYWIPCMGAVPLVHALKTHLYLFCVGQFGKCFFESLVPSEFHPKLGPIFSGPLKPLQTASRAFFGHHAVLVIGLRMRSFIDGDVYFIDPTDPSGPGLQQIVYKIRMIDFFYRIRDSFGSGPIFSFTSEYVWVGNPALFLA